MERRGSVKKKYKLSRQQRLRKITNQRWKRLKVKIQKQFLSLDPPVHVAAICVVSGRNPGLDIVGSDIIRQTLFTEEALDRLQQQLFNAPTHSLPQKKKVPLSEVFKRCGKMMGMREMRTFVAESVAKYVLQVFHKKRGFWGKEEMKPSWWPEGLPFVSPSVSGVTKEDLLKICEAINAHETKDRDQDKPPKKRNKKRDSKKSDKKTKFQSQGHGGSETGGQ